MIHAFPPPAPAVVSPTRPVPRALLHLPVRRDARGAAHLLERDPPEARGAQRAVLRVRALHLPLVRRVLLRRGLVRRRGARRRGAAVLDAAARAAPAARRRA